MLVPRLRVGLRKQPAVLNDKNSSANESILA